MDASDFNHAKRRAPLEANEMPAAGQIGEVFELPERVSHYLGDVLRLKPGEVVDLFDGSGRVVQAKLVDTDAAPLSVHILADRVVLHGESPLEITLVQAIPKGKRFELVLEKATELGVARIIPLETARTVVQISASKADSKVERWERIVEGAARQSGRTVTPEICAPMNLKAALKTLEDIPSFVAHTAEDLPSLAATIQAEKQARRGATHPDEFGAAALWIGPEGGFSADEIDLFTRHGARPFHLGPRVLRAETAGLVGLSLLQAYLGDFA